MQWPPVLCILCATTSMKYNHVTLRCVCLCVAAVTYIPAHSYITIYTLWYTRRDWIIAATD